MSFDVEADASSAPEGSEPQQAALGGLASLEPLAESARWLFHAQALVRMVVVWMPLLVMATVGAAIVTSPTLALIVGSFALMSAFVLSVWWPKLVFERWGYAVRESELLIAHGVLFRRIIAIPLSRVQHVDVRQGPLEQWLQLGRIYVHTASGLGSDGVIPGLQMPVAMALRDKLIAAGNRGDDGV